MSKEGICTKAAEILLQESKHNGINIDAAVGLAVKVCGLEKLQGRSNSKYRIQEYVLHVFGILHNTCYTALCFPI
jgi:hypothetical protein